MRIGFDARMIDHPGIGRYIKNLLLTILSGDHDLEFVLFGDPQKLSGFKKFKNCSIREYKTPIYSRKDFFSDTFSGEEFDIVHIPHFNVPLRDIKNLVITIHDLIYIMFPESSSYFKRLAVKHAFSNAVKKASKIIAVSENTRKDIVKYFPDAEGKIKVIHEAADKQFRRVNDIRIIEEVMKKYDLSDRIILYIGSVKPHKNMATLIKVYDKLKGFGIPHQLVIAGRWDEKENYLRKRMNSKGVRYIGEIPTEDINVLYSFADVLVHLSRYEGFGLTVLEAMQCGTPVVVSDVSSLPEIAGKAGLAVSPLNVGQIADTVYNVIVNRELRKGMVSAGLERARQFSWEKTAQETLDIYFSV